MFRKSTVSGALEEIRNPESYLAAYGSVRPNNLFDQYGNKIEDIDAFLRKLKKTEPASIPHYAYATGYRPQENSSYLTKKPEPACSRVTQSYSMSNQHSGNSLLKEDVGTTAPRGACGGKSPLPGAGAAASAAKPEGARTYEDTLRDYMESLGSSWVLH